jgi:phytoene desaturase
MGTDPEQFPGNETAWTGSSRRRNAASLPLHKGLFDVASLLSWTLLRAAPYLSPTKSVFDNLGRFFDDEKLKLSFTFQAKYLGMSAWECPALFTMLPFVEHEYGIYHVIGGLNQISQAMAKVVEEAGGKIHTSTAVKSLWIEGKTVDASAWKRRGGSETSSRQRDLPTP